MLGTAKATNRKDRRNRHPISTALAVLVALLLAACSANDLEHVAMHAKDPETSAAPFAETLGSTVMFGAFTYGGVWSGMEPVLELETSLGRRLDIVHWFTSWDTPYYPELVAAASQGGRLPLISWQPVNQKVADIAAGLHDDYIRAWAQGVASNIGPVYVRPFPEMNGSWTPWNGDTPTFRAAWRRMVGIFEAAGATNVRWVFSPNVTDEPRTDANRMEHYYPGHEYVHVLALDGYNWGEANVHYPVWQSFREVFERGYERIVAMGEQPVWIAELASSDEGGDKASWVTDMFNTTGFDRIEALVWFDEDKEADWRIASDTSVLSAFQTALARGAVVAASGTVDAAD